MTGYKQFLLKETKMSDDRIGDHCWGRANQEWRRGHLRLWIPNANADATAIFEDKETGKVIELLLDELNFERDMPK